MLGRLVVVIEADDRKMFGQQAALCQIVERRHDKAFGEIAVRAEYHSSRKRVAVATASTDAGARSRVLETAFELAFDMAAELVAHGREKLLAESCDQGAERKRAKNSAAERLTLAGTASSMAALMVQRPSPESST